MKRPVLVLGYNRPEKIAALLDSLPRAPISQLFVWLDGPKENSDSDFLRCREVRELILAFSADFPVHRNFSSANLGCKESVSRGIDWFFSEVDAGLILEDDCVPSDGFFDFADKLLTHYRDDETVLTISGHQRLARWSDEKNSFHFSRYPHVWGWATWSKVWKQFDKNISAWDLLRETDWLKSEVGLTADAARFWRYQFDRVRAGEVDTWDYQLTFLSFQKNGMNLSPHSNFISNLGFGSDATHTQMARPNWLVSKLDEPQPLSFPANKLIDKEKDREIELLIYRTKRSAREYAELLAMRFIRWFKTRRPT